MPDDPSTLDYSRGLRFRDRPDAGRQLAGVLAGRVDTRSVVVVGIPRGGVPVAAEVAQALRSPLDVVVVCKLGAPRNPEYAVGALAEGDIRVFDEQAVRVVGLSERQLDQMVVQARQELERRLARYRRARAAAPLSGRTAIVVDDGLATGRSALAAVRSLRKRGAARVILAVPVGAPGSLRTLRLCADEVVCVRQPDDLWAVGCWYEDFRPTTDEEVAGLLVRCH